MLTAGRLAAAIFFGAVGWYFSQEATPFFEDGQIPSYWLQTCVAIGVVCAWMLNGKKAGVGYSGGVGQGLTTIVAFAFWVLFTVSFFDMIAKSMRNRYDGPVEAVVDVFALMGEYVLDFASIQLGLILLVGGIAGGLFTEFVAKRAS